MSCLPSVDPAELRWEKLSAASDSVAPIRSAFWRTQLADQVASVYRVGAEWHLMISSAEAEAEGLTDAVAPHMISGFRRRCDAISFWLASLDPAVDELRDPRGLRWAVADGYLQQLKPDGSPVPTDFPAE